MDILLLLLIILVGTFTYSTLKSRVAYITKTPVWLLWLVLMMPIVVSLWLSLTYGDRLSGTSIIGVFLGSWILYLILVQWGRKPPPAAIAPEPSENADSEIPAPSSPEQSKVRPIDTTEESNLRNCFPWSVYYLEKIEYLPQAVLCRGKLRSSPEQAYETIRDNIKDLFGDRFFVIFQESLSGKPFFALVPNTQAQQPLTAAKERAKELKISIILLFMTLFTTTWNGLEIAGVGEAAANPELIGQGFLYSVPLLAILGFRELGHYFTAKINRIRASLPLFFPEPFLLGTLGAFVHMRSPVPNRKILFDISIIGLIAGLVITLPIFGWGLHLSSLVPLVPEKTGLFNFDTFNPRFSLLLTLLTKLFLGSQLTSEVAIDLHPLAVAGYVGILFTALNLIPVGSLDGGHILHAMLGQKNAIAIGQLARLFMMLRGFSYLKEFGNPDFLGFSFLIFLLPISNQPALNDISELDNRRDFGGLIALTLLIAIFVPLPEAVAAWLNV